MVRQSGRAALSALQALALWFGIAALMLQGLVPTGAIAADGRSIVICTAHGMETIRLGSDGKPLAAQTNPGSNRLACSVCSDCTAASGFTLPSPILAGQLLAFVEAVLFVPNISAPLTRVYRPYGSRAPPSLT
jgi:hypothetical protein